MDYRLVYTIMSYGYNIVILQYLYYRVDTTQVPTEISMFNLI